MVNKMKFARNKIIYMNKYTFIICIFCMTIYTKHNMRNGEENVNVFISE